MPIKTKKAQSAKLKSVKFNSFSDVVAPLDKHEQGIVLDLLMDSEISWGTNSFTLVDAQWLISELEFLSKELTINNKHINKAIKRVTAAWIDMES